LLEETKEVLSRAYSKAEEIIDRDAIKPEIYDGVGEEEFDRDFHYLEEREKEIEENHKATGTEESARYAVVLEALMHEAGQKSQWFGEKAKTIKTSRIDDIRAGVDEVVSIENSKDSLSHFGLAIDVTYKESPRSKFASIKREIQSGRLASVKYFTENKGEKMHALNDLPRFVVGADIGTVTELVDMWLRDDEKGLREHPIQYQILEELLRQSLVFQKFAIKMNQKAIADKYQKAAQIIQEIVVQKQRKIRDTKNRDSVYKSIVEELSHFDEI